MLPPWLNDASAVDQARYSRHLLDLTTVQHEHNGKTFQSEVIGLHAYTRDALMEQMSKDQPSAKDIKLDDIEITITSLVVWGTFVLPGNTSTQTLTLPELALQNLAGLPLGNKTVNYKAASSAPDWMTVAYLEKLVSAVDIGRTYPAYLKARLIDDADQASALKALYTGQLRIELPLLALQHKIQGRADIDDAGYRYVAAALAATDAERYVDGQEIVVRPLAFVAHRSSCAADSVANMYVIGPREVNKGPCLLYRPLFEMTLMQFPDRPTSSTRSSIRDICAIRCWRGWPMMYVSTTASSSLPPGCHRYGQSRRCWSIRRRLWTCPARSHWAHKR
ncbi:hypothetical protein LJJ44_23820 [Pseudomonas sp. B24_DOA]|nr:hypothetical protein LJJ44_23820 [Pseudomonas sp. B24_DOA]